MFRTEDESASFSREDPQLMLAEFNCTMRQLLIESRMRSEDERFHLLVKTLMRTNEETRDEGVTFEDITKQAELVQSYSEVVKDCISDTEKLLRRVRHDDSRDLFTGKGKSSIPGLNSTANLGTVKSQREDELNQKIREVCTKF